MIVKMKKVSLVILDKYREESLKKLREIGVLHLEKLQGSGEEYDRIYALHERIAAAEASLPSLDSDTSVEYTGIDKALEWVEEIEDLSSRRKKHGDRLNFLLRELERVEPLGDFNTSTAAFLSERGLPVTLYMVNKSENPLFSENGAFMVGETKAKSYFAVVGVIPEALSGEEIFEMPELGPSEMRNAAEMESAELDIIEKRLIELTGCREALKKAYKETGSRLDFETVRSGINVDEKLSWLSGFCPVPVLEDLQKAASENGWGIVIDDPTEEDEVPTQLKLSKFAGILTPILDFLGILPGYREYDVSFFFLCFFSIFTAMLIGDAGYGFIFLALTVAGMAVFGRNGKIPRIFFLLLLLSVTTIIWGAVSGTWFASKSIMSIGFFENLKLNAFKVGEQDQISLVMGISFFLGIVQLLIGVVQNFIKNFPKKSSFAQIGWFAVLVAIYYLVLTLVVKRAGLETYPQEMLYVLLFGVIVIFLFGSQEEGQSFFKGVLNSLSNFLQLFLDVVGTFSDIMSYVRLFAVGLASVKIAETFNQLGAGMSEGPIIIFGILIVIIGHSMNIVLGLMAILVHAVRLNILEYSGKVGVEWSGFKYEPFKVNTDLN